MNHRKSRGESCRHGIESSGYGRTCDATQSCKWYNGGEIPLDQGKGAHSNGFKGLIYMKRNTLPKTTLVGSYTLTVMPLNRTPYIALFQIFSRVLVVAVTILLCLLSIRLEEPNH